MVKLTVRGAVLDVPDGWGVAVGVDGAIILTPPASEMMDMVRRVYSVDRPKPVPAGVHVAETRGYVPDIHPSLGRAVGGDPKDG